MARSSPAAARGANSSTGNMRWANGGAGAVRAAWVTSAAGAATADRVLSRPRRPASPTAASVTGGMPARPAPLTGGATAGTNGVGGAGIEGAGSPHQLGHAQGRHERRCVTQANAITSPRRQHAAAQVGSSITGHVVVQSGRTHPAARRHAGSTFDVSTIGGQYHGLPASRRPAPAPGRWAATRVPRLLDDLRRHARDHERRALGVTSNAVTLTADFVGQHVKSVRDIVLAARRRPDRRDTVGGNIRAIGGLAITGGGRPFCKAPHLYRRHGRSRLATLTAITACPPAAPSRSTAERLRHHEPGRRRPVRAAAADSGLGVSLTRHAQRPTLAASITGGSLVKQGTAR